MTYVLPVHLETFHSGLIIVQKEPDMNAFVASIDGVFKDHQVNSARNFYEHGTVNLNGLCSVHIEDGSWFILIFAKTLERAREVAVHELVHLGELLSKQSGITPGPETQEIRARLVTTIYQRFCDNVPSFYNSANSETVTHVEVTPVTERSTEVSQESRRLIDAAAADIPRESTLEIIIYCILAAIVAIGLVVLSAIWSQ